MDKQKINLLRLDVQEAFQAFADDIVPLLEHDFEVHEVVSWPAEEGSIKVHVNFEREGLLSATDRNTVTRTVRNKVLPMLRNLTESLPNLTFHRLSVEVMHDTRVKLSVILEV